MEHRAKVGEGVGGELADTEVVFCYWCVRACMRACVRVSTCVCVCYSMLYMCPSQTGLTPLMEAASGGYHEVGRILVEHVSR